MAMTPAPPNATGLSETPQIEPIRIRTLALLRWFAIGGQVATTIVALAMASISR